MTDKEKTCRLVLRSQDCTQFPSQRADWKVNINMGNMITNRDDLAYLQLDQCTNIIVFTRSSFGNTNIFNTIEIVADTPQYNSYDTHTASQTTHICFLEREPTQKATQGDGGLDVTNPDLWQTWVMQHKPSFVVVRPEVFQCKTWQITARFVGDIRSENVMQAPAIAYMSDFEAIHAAKVLAPDCRWLVLHLHKYLKMLCCCLWQYNGISPAATLLAALPYSDSVCHYNTFPRCRYIPAVRSEHMTPLRYWSSEPLDEKWSSDTRDAAVWTSDGGSTAPDVCVSCPMIFA